MVVAWVLSASYGCAHVYFRVNQVSNAEAAKTDPEVAMAVMILSMKVTHPYGHVHLSAHAKIQSA